MGHPRKNFADQLNTKIKRAIKELVVVYLLLLPHPCDLLELYLLANQQLWRAEDEGVGAAAGGREKDDEEKGRQRGRGGQENPSVSCPVSPLPIFL